MTKNIHISIVLIVTIRSNIIHEMYDHNAGFMQGVIMKKIALIALVLMCTSLVITGCKKEKSEANTGSFRCCCKIVFLKLFSILRLMQQNKVYRML